MDLFTAVKNELNNEKTFTTNGAVAYKTSGSSLVDMNFQVSALRSMSEHGISNMFSRAFYEDKMSALKYLFYLGDVRGGLGERRSFRIGCDWLATNHPELMVALLELVPEYTRWDNLIRMVGNKNVWNEVVSIIDEQLAEDVKGFKNNQSISLLAKWMPSEWTRDKEKKKYHSLLRGELGLSKREYRKLMSSLRRYLDVVEVKMSGKEWSEIDYETVPSKANLKYNSAFLKHDEERRREYLSKLEKGQAKINSTVLHPHEIVSKYGVCNGWRFTNVDKNATLEAMWKGMRQVELENCLVVRDGSGSMLSPVGSGVGANGIRYYTKTTCLDVSTALAIYMSEHNTGIWKDKFITFSARPKMIDLKNCFSLHEKLSVCKRENDCSNTDMYGVMQLILDAAVKSNLKQEDMPSSIVIVSDMQFDGRGHHFNKSLFDEIKREYKKHGYLLPKIVFWNVAGRCYETTPMKENELGLVLCSGFSVSIMEMFTGHAVDPYEALMEVLNKERYDKVEEAVKGLL